MKAIRVSRILHRQQRRIFLHFEHDKALNQFFKSLPGARWSRTHKCWHIPDSKTILQDIQKQVPDDCCFEEGDMLPLLLVENEKRDHREATKQEDKYPDRPKAQRSTILQISEVNMVALQTLIDLLMIDFSVSTRW